MRSPKTHFEADNSSPLKLTVPPNETPLEESVVSVASIPSPTSMYDSTHNQVTKIQLESQANSFVETIKKTSEGFGIQNATKGTQFQSTMKFKENIDNDDDK